MNPDGRTDRQNGRTDARSDDAKTISLRLRRGIITPLCSLLHTLLKDKCRASENCKSLVLQDKCNIGICLSHEQVSNEYCIKGRNKLYFGWNFEKCLQSLDMLIKDQNQNKLLNCFYT